MGKQAVFTICYSIFSKKYDIGAELVKTKVPQKHINSPTVITQP